MLVKQVHTNGIIKQTKKKSENAVEQRRSGAVSATATSVRIGLQPLHKPHEQNIQPSEKHVPQPEASRADRKGQTSAENANVILDSIKRD